MESITGLFSDLCGLHTRDWKRASTVHPNTDRKKINKRLKRKLYDGLFTFLKSKHGKGKDVEVRDNVKTQIWWCSLQLRHKRKFDEANRLEALFNNLTQQGAESGCEDGLNAAVQVLLKLKDTGKAPSRETLGHGDMQLPVLPKRGEKPMLPEGPLCYGDTQLIQTNRFHYMHYPRAVFEAEPLEIVNTIGHVCEMVPGTGLDGNGFFGMDGYLGDSQEKTTRESLFGGLVQDRVTSLDIKLELPDLTEDNDERLIETRILKSSSSYSVDDEGFKSQEESVTSSNQGDEELVAESSVDSAFQSDYDTSIYEDCLSATISQHYTWETIGLGPGPRMKPFLCEAGPLAFDQWNQAMLVWMKTAFPGTLVAPRVAVRPEILVEEVLSVMIAVPSVNFMLDLTDQCFSVREGIYMSGVSSEALQNLLEDFLTCGMYYYRLSLFSATPIINSFYRAGLTFQAFTGGVERVLHYYRAAILSLPRSTTLLQLRVKCQQLIHEIKFLACLCRCDNPVTEETKDAFPTGVDLLSYIYHEALESSFSTHYPLMLSLLKTTCTPYLVFVQDWVYHGVFRDQFGEFMVEVNDDYLQFKDKHYWTHGYTLKRQSVEESVPLFLKDMASDIFVCGKSINLLKACNRNHFMCSIDYNDIPQITLTFSETELQALAYQCTIYTSKMQQVARQNILSREEMQERKERAKQDLIAKARLVAAKELQIVQDKMTEIKKAVDAKKRKELAFLKSQMEKDLKRRAGEKVSAAEADQAFMARLTQQEGAVDEERAELERQAREEVIAYYRNLSEEAARREQKALWRVRRARLDIARVQFLEQQERQWAVDMDAYKAGQTEGRVADPVVALPVQSEGDLPRWAQRDGPTIQVTEDVNVNATGSEDNLPGWAQREGPTVHVTEGSDLGLPGSSNKQLPKWAQKGLQKYGMGPRSVGQTPGQATPVQKSPDLSANKESEESILKPSIQTYSHMHATTETTSCETAQKPQVKLVGGMHATTETEEEEVTRAHVKSVGEKRITDQSEPEPDARPHLKTVADRHANKLSDLPEHDAVPRLKPGSSNISTETSAVEWKIKEQSQFGHASQTSSSYLDLIPKLKKSDVASAWMESEMSFDFGIKPRLKMHKSRSATTESEETVVKPQIKPSTEMSATKESVYVDMDAKRTKMFKERNIYGHATDSTVQQLLYGVTEQEQSEQGGSAAVVTPERLVWVPSKVEPYQDNFDFLDDPPRVDLMSDVPSIQYGIRGASQYGDIEGYQYRPLPAVIKTSITGPLMSQISLVNSSIVSYYMRDLHIDKHFMALRRYLCMADGDFSEILCDFLMEKLATNPRPQDLVNAMFLNNCLNKAIRLSINADDAYTDNLSFMQKFLPSTMEHTSPDVLDCIQLHYDVKWPINIVITKTCLEKYTQVFSFMLQLKRVVWVLKDVWHRLKRDAIVHGAARCGQFHQLHLYRQEMQHFVKVMQEYISHQIVEVSWQEFQTGLKKDVHNLDDLHNVHQQYLDSALFRCLLTKKAASLMKCIQGIFRLILKYHRQLVSGSWRTDPAGVTSHSNHAQLYHTYKVFVEHSTFMFKVVSKLAVRGYYPHLHDLLMRLNFNGHYQKQT